MFEEPLRLALGLLTGFIFGFLLQKGQVTKFRTIVGQFLLRDFTVMKVMLTAIVVGGIGVYALAGVGWASLHVKPALLGGVIGGGAIFGIGMAILGYCPGTGVGAMAEGSRHAIYGVLGMLFGAAVYAEVYPLMVRSVLAWGDYGEITLPTVTGLSPWAWLALLAAGSAAVFYGVERWERRGGRPAKGHAEQAGALAGSQRGTGPAA